jgi:homoserine kinase
LNLPFDQALSRPGVSETVHRVARVPASAANIGPGFDALAVALKLYVEVELTARPEGLLVVAEGEGAHLPLGPSHLAARVAREVLGHDRVELHVRSQIPVARGLGSSAALAVAAAAAAGAKDPFAYGFAVDGHPENAAASAMGGLVVAAVVDGAPVARHLRLDPDIRFVALVPDEQLATSRARGRLPELVPHKDAAFNLGRLGLLVAGLADHTQLLAAAGDDRLHQSQRSSLFPQAPDLLAGLRSAGALTSCWSGAGPSVLGICSADDAAAVAVSARSLMTRLGLKGEVLVLEADLTGTVVREIC